MQCTWLGGLLYTLLLTISLVTARPSTKSSRHSMDRRSVNSQTKRDINLAAVCTTLCKKARGGSLCNCSTRHFIGKRVSTQDPIFMREVKHNLSSKSAAMAKNEIYNRLLLSLARKERLTSDNARPVKDAIDTFYSHVPNRNMRTIKAYKLLKSIAAFR